MSEANTSQQTTRSNAELARLVIRVAEAAQPEAIICITETGALAQRLYGLLHGFRIVAATTNRDTYGYSNRKPLIIQRSDLEMELGEKCYPNAKPPARFRAIRVKCPPPVATQSSPDL